MKDIALLYKTELLDHVLPFWDKYSIDTEDGGYFTCLLPNGSVFDTDKFVWLQARQVWAFSHMYDQLGPNQRWLDIAEHGAAFLLSNGRDHNGDWYFSLNKQGAPLVQAYNIFSDCFATMAFGKLYKTTQNDTYKQVALTTFEKILKRQNNPKGKYNKGIQNTRPLKNFSLPMILCNLCLEIENILDADLVKDTIDICIDTVMDQFYDEKSGLIFENILENGDFSDSFDGRLINPGHVIEAMWFVIELAERENNIHLINKAIKIILTTLEFGWDSQEGGIYYFLDSKGHPPQQLEWDQKLWWVHLETIIALSKAMKYSNETTIRDRFDKVHNYTWDHFRDTKNGGEWFGYLNRKGEVLLDLKGGKWKGCFHVPRALLKVSEALSEL